MFHRDLVAAPEPASDPRRDTHLALYFRYLRTLTPVACLIVLALGDVFSSIATPPSMIAWTVVTYVAGVGYQAIVVGTRVPPLAVLRGSLYADTAMIAIVSTTLDAPEVLNAAYLWPVLVASCFLAWRDVACVAAFAAACSLFVPLQAGSTSSAPLLWSGPVVLGALGAVLAVTTRRSRATELELQGERDLEDLVLRFTQRAAGQAPIEASLRELELDICATFDCSHAWIDIAGIDRPRRALPGTAVVRVTWNDEQVARISVALAGGHPVGPELVRKLERVATFVGAVISQSEALRRHEAANERLREADQLKDKFLAMASHELRTPLTSIRGFSETMVRQWEILPDEDKLRFLAIVSAQSERLARLVEDVMLLSGIQSGRFELRPSPVRVEHAVDRAIRELDEPTIGIGFDPDVRAFVDPDHFQLMLVNVLDNAVRHGGGDVEVSWDTWDGDVVVTVADRGAGVGDELLPRLFGEFQRDRGATSGSGPGLGLSIVRTLARAHGGDAWYEPNVPSGSRFLVRLPAVPN